MKKPNKNAIKSKRRLLSERLEQRHLMAGDVLSPSHLPTHDVNNDSVVSIADVHRVLEAIDSPGDKSTGNESTGNDGLVADVDRSGFVSARDALLILNGLNENSEITQADIAEGEQAGGQFDVDGNGSVTARDALMVINFLHNEGEQVSTETETSFARYDTDSSGDVTARDALLVINHIEDAQQNPVDSEDEESTLAKISSIEKASGVDADGVEGAADRFFASLNKFEASPEFSTQNLLETADVETLLQRASMATASEDAIIAVVDRSGRILGVRVEAGVSSALTSPGNEAQLAFAIDGAVAKARTAAFFSSNAAPLTSRTIRFISQSTITQREVESSPTNLDPRYQGPGFVAPIGVGGHFPPEVAFTPQVDLFAIEHQSRDSQFHAGEDTVKGTGDDFTLGTRFNANPEFIPKNAETFFETWPESYGVASGTSLESQSRGIATLPGGIPLYKFTQLEQNDDGTSAQPNLSDKFNLVGGIGVFFPGEDGFATHEQGFQHGINQSEKARTNAPKVLEAEFAALIAAAGSGLIGPNAFVRDLSRFNNALPALPEPGFFTPTSRIDLVGITLEIFGPTPDRSHPIPGIDRLIQVGDSLGRGIDSGINQQVDLAGETLLAGQAVPEEWLVAPHASSIPGGLSAADVEQIIEDGIAEAERTRAAIRLDIDNDLRPGATTGMVFSVADTNGELLGLFRMPDATIFSIDVSIAKSRNTAYYADANALQDSDRIDFNEDGTFGRVSQSLNDTTGDTVPLGTALTNRTFRFIVEPRFPTGSEGGPIGPHSILRMPGINSRTAENLIDDQPMEFSTFTDQDATFLAFDAFVPARNFRDPGDEVPDLSD